MNKQKLEIKKWKNNNKKQKIKENNKFKKYTQQNK